MNLLIRCLALVAGLLLPASQAQAAWTPIDFPRSDVTLRAVVVARPGGFQVSGSKGTHATTLDGGRTWRLTRIAGTEALDFRGLAVLDARTALLMSAGDAPAGQARLYRTADGGASWSQVYSTEIPGGFLDTLRFWDRSHGLVLGDPIDGAWFLLRTSDGGRTWTRVKATLPPLQPGEAAFAASNSALILSGRAGAWIATGGGSHGRIFRSTDRGRTWQAADTPIDGGPTGGVFGGLALGREGGVIVGGDHKDELRAAPSLAVTADGGRTWTVAPRSGTPRLLESVGRLNARTLIAVGPRGTAFSTDDGRSWSQADQEAFHAISCAAGTCVAVGAKGRVGVWR
ncbi:YCF48-related protein [Phenylobacterium sp.]|uniref:WD40/YVTN/BNR-like repeat-containing protein n=1 Tax=Phenylobacterium sp. TaxID=1871053 RepID=UPI0025ECD092|nr:YCF48-related protein [Phenylobacterium sp.]